MHICNDERRVVTGRVCAQSDRISCACQYHARFVRAKITHDKGNQEARIGPRKAATVVASLWAQGPSVCLLRARSSTRHGRRKGEARTPGLFKLQQKMVVVLLSSGKKQISPLLASPRKILENTPGKNPSDAHGTQWTTPETVRDTAEQHLCLTTDQSHLVANHAAIPLPASDVARLVTVATPQRVLALGKDEFPIGGSDARLVAWQQSARCRFYRLQKQQQQKHPFQGSSTVERRTTKASGARSEVHSVRLQPFRWSGSLPSFSERSFRKPKTTGVSLPAVPQLTEGLRGEFPPWQAKCKNRALIRLIFWF